MTIFDQGVTPGEQSVVIIPSIWESDGSGDILHDWGQTIARVGGTIAHAAAILAGQPGTGMTLQTGLDMGLRPAVELLERILGQAGDRPIGMMRQGESYELPIPHVLTLNTAGLQAASQANFGKGPGVIELNFRDDPSLQGDYTMYLKFEWMEFDESIPG
jgi:hypothetical protein